MPDVERLEQLRRVVLEAPPERFQMGSFGRPTPCGTAACAAGWAFLDPWFRANTTIAGAFAFTPEYPDDPESPGWITSSSGTFGLLAEIFGISPEETERLFGANLCVLDFVEKDEVLANIDRLIAGEEPARYDPIPAVEHLDEDPD